jgi:hypothetical protein
MHSTGAGGGIGWVPGGDAQAREPQQPQGGEPTGSQQSATATATGGRMLQMEGS